MRLAALAVVLGATSASPQSPEAAGPAIDHGAVGCVVAEQFALIQARLEAEQGIARARTYFRAEGGPHWYYVEMRPEAGGFVGVLPKPKKTTKRINYYVDAADRAFAESRTQEYAPEVVPRALDCKEKALAGTAPSASIKVQGPPGAPPIPLGFLAAGIASSQSSEPAAVTGSSHGLSKKTLSIAGAVVVAGGVAVAAAGGGDKNQPPSAGAITVAPPGQALASATRLTFTGSGTDPDGDALNYSWAFGDGASGSGTTVTHVYEREGTFQPVLTVSDAKASATATGSSLAARELNGSWLVTLASSRLRPGSFVLNQSGAALAGQRIVAGLTAPVSGRVADPRSVTLESPGASASGASYAEARPRTLWDGLVGLFQRATGGPLPSSPARAWSERPRVVAQYTPKPTPQPTPEPTPKPPRSPYESQALCPFTATLSFGEEITEATGTLTPLGACERFGPAAVTMRRQ